MKVSGNTSRFFLSFDVDSRYNGKTVVVLHKIADGNYEEFESVVKDGKVSIETSSLSPFMIVAKEDANANIGSNANNGGSNTATTATATKPNSPSTPDTGVAATSDNSGAISAMFGYVIFGAAGCLTAVCFTIKKVLVRKKAQEA